MSITWSISRDQVLHTCERRYYFQYIVNAKINSRDRILREIAFLKKLKNIPMWKGDVFHSVIADYLRKVRQGTYLTCADLLDGLQGRMKREWTFSESRIFRLDPRAINQDDGLALYEHEYEDEPEQDITRLIEDVANWVSQFLAWAEDRDLEGLIGKATKVWIEPPTYGPSAPGFTIEGVQVLAKVDFALLTQDGRFEIFDWKTGIPPSYASQQIDQSEFQVNVYQLWPHLTLGHSLHVIKAHLVYVATDPVYQETFKMDENLREYTLSFVRRSIARVKHFSDSPKGKRLSLEDFDFATYVTACWRCTFKRLCQRILKDG